MITMVGSDCCPECDRAEKTCQSYGIEYTKITDMREGAAEICYAELPISATLPVVICETDVQKQTMEHILPKATVTVRKRIASE